MQFIGVNQVLILWMMNDKTWELCLEYNGSTKECNIQYLLQLNWNVISMLYECLSNRICFTYYYITKM